MIAQPEGSVSADSASSTQEALVAAGLANLAEHGYAGSRLTDIASRAGLTTGAFYRYFGGKLDLYRSLWDAYADTLLAALNASASLSSQFEAWIEISRRYKGAIRAAAELCRRDTEEAAQRQRLRDAAANLLARYLDAGRTWRQTRTEALMLVDILDQYMMMEAAQWTVDRTAESVAHAMHRLVADGLYQA